MIRNFVVVVAIGAIDTAVVYFDLNNISNI